MSYLAYSFSLSLSYSVTSLSLSLSRIEMHSLTLANLSLFDAKQSSSAYEYLISANAHELFSMTKARKAIITSRHVTSRRVERTIVTSNLTLKIFTFKRKLNRETMYQNKQIIVAMPVWPGAEIKSRQKFPKVVTVFFTWNLIKSK